MHSYDDLEKNRWDMEETDWQEIKHMLWWVWIRWLHFQFALTVIACLVYWDDVC
jgi:hypothetical protein